MPLPLPPPALHAPACVARQLSLRLDGEGGAFDGMSHAGTRLILTNVGPRICTLPGLPRVSFRDRAGRPLPVARRAPPGMHPGPVVVPVALRPGGRATTGLRWVSGEVFDRSRCLTPASVRVTGDGFVLTARIVARLCGPAGAPAAFDQPPLAAG